MRVAQDLQAVCPFRYPKMLSPRMTIDRVPAATTCWYVTGVAPAV
jgi:hypothetical protein